MFKKIIYYKIFFVFGFVKEAYSAESGGMPQLDPEFWFSQIFWLTITFGFLFIFLSKIVLPKVSDNLEKRKSQVKENIETAEKHRLESEDKLKEFEKIILENKIEAKNYFNEARQKIIGELDKKKDTLEKEINSEIKSAEKEILDLKSRSSKKINDIAIQTCSDLIQQFVGVQANNSSITAIVNDLSKKHKDSTDGA